MQTHTNVNAKSAALSYEITMRLRIGIFLATCELFTYLALSMIPKEWFYIALIPMTSIVVLMMPLVAKGSKLAAEMRDLAVFEIGAALFGQVMLDLGYESTAFFIVVNSIFALKAIRLCWPVKTADGNDFAGWPIIGLFSYRHTQEQTKNDPALRLFVWDRNTQLVCLFIGLCLPIGIFLTGHRMMSTAIWGMLALAYLIATASDVLDLGKALTGAKSESQELRIAKAELADLKAQLAATQKALAEAQAIGPLDSKEIEIVLAYRDSDPVERWHTVDYAKMIKRLFPFMRPDGE